LLAEVIASMALQILIGIFTIIQLVGVPCLGVSPNKFDASDFEGLSKEEIDRKERESKGKRQRSKDIIIVMMVFTFLISVINYVLAEFIMK